MKNKLNLLIRDGLKKKIGTKWFKIVNIILLIMILILTNIDSIIKSFGGDFEDITKIYVIDDSNVFYESLNYAFENDETINSLNIDAQIIKSEKTYEDLINTIKENEENDIILSIKKENGRYKANITSYKYVDAVKLQVLTSLVNSIKTNLALMESNIPKEEIENIIGDIQIERTYLSEDLDENKEVMESIGAMLIPVFIMPFFFLLIMVIQMIGAEINEEKTSKSMEIIISSVPAKIHFLSKLITTNLYALLQLFLFALYIVLGLSVRMLVTGRTLVDSFSSSTGNIISTFLNSDIFSNIISALPFILIMIVLSFIAYSLLAGVLASMTTSQEDFSQLQTPMMIMVMAGYFLSLMASTYENSVFITVVSTLPFISCILSPVLFILGQITIYHVIISIALLLLTIYLLIKYGSRIYKVGVLNYSTNGLWKKMIKSLKEK